MSEEKASQDFDICAIFLGILFSGWPLSLALSTGIGPDRSGLPPCDRARDCNHKYHINGLGLRGTFLMIWRLMQIPRVGWHR
jgi:hypothetical protein